MRIRSSAASIAAVMLTAGLLTGCTSPAPAPTESPTASAATPEPTPSPTAEAAPDLAALCEQLLPLETVQERFGDDSILLTGRPSARADISGWSGLLRGRLDCDWGTPSDRNVVVTLSRGDADFFDVMYEQVEERNGGSEVRFDTFGRSLDGCDELYPSCQYSVLLNGEDQLEVDLSPDYGSTLLPEEEIRERWDPEVERMMAAADGILASLPIVDPQPVDCASMLSVDEARELLGTDEVFSYDIANGFHDMSLFGVGGPTLSDLDRCDWSNYGSDPMIAVMYTADPGNIRSSAFGSVSATSADPSDGVRGEQVEIIAADEAWLYCYPENSGRGDCGLDLQIGGLWLQVEGPDEAITTKTAERIAANLTR